MKFILGSPRVICRSIFADDHDLSQIIDELTRICATRNSILDLTFVSDIEKFSKSGVMPIGISDNL